MTRISSKSYSPINHFKGPVHSGKSSKEFQIKSERKESTLEGVPKFPILNPKAKAIIEYLDKPPVDPTKLKNDLVNLRDSIYSHDDKKGLNELIDSIDRGFVDFESKKVINNVKGFLTNILPNMNRKDMITLLQDCIKNKVDMPAEYAIRLCKALGDLYEDRGGKSVIADFLHGPALNAIQTLAKDGVYSHDLMSPVLQMLEFFPDI